MLVKNFLNFGENCHRPQIILILLDGNEIQNNNFIAVSFDKKWREFHKFQVEKVNHRILGQENSAPETQNQEENHVNKNITLMSLDRQRLEQGCRQLDR